MRSSDFAGRGTLWPLAVAVVLVIARSFVFVAYEHAHFDSDQAVVGLMALHLGHLQSFPLFFYGQHYLLGVEAWIAAPFLLAFGTSVTSLKLPLLAINVVVAVTLTRLLAREEGVSPWQALCAVLFFVIPTPITASRLVEAQGANIEPFLYVLLLWLLRRHPIWFGLIFGVGFLHREFTLYAPVALVTQYLQRRPISIPAAAAYLSRAAVAAGAIFLAVRILAPPPENIDNVTQPPGLHSIAVAEVPSRLVALATQNLPVLFGMRSEPLARFNITSTLAAGHWWVTWLLGAALTTMLIRLISVGPRARAVNEPADGSGTNSGFAVYVILVGAQALLAHAVVSGAGGMLIRYTLLGVLLPVGLTALWFRVETARPVRIAVIAMLIGTAATALADHARLAAEYRWRRPPNLYRELAETLILNGASHGRADYWVAYYVSFLTAERVILEPTTVSRIAEYRDRVAAQPAAAVLVTEAPCEGGRRVRHWYICTP